MSDANCNRDNRHSSGYVGVGNDGGVRKAAKGVPSILRRAF